MQESLYQSIDGAIKDNRLDILRLGLSFLFIIGIMLYVFVKGNSSLELVIAATIGGYMALNIGANDVANNCGPAVGSKALTLTGAIVIAAIFEASGAMLAGGNVVSTIKKGIIDPALISDPQVFVWLMMSALLSAAVWLNLATASGAPVSTTHSIVGGVLGAGIAAGGLEIANWDKMASIVASWVISPVMGGLIAAGCLFWIKRSITYADDKVVASKKWVPLLIALMAWAFSTYLVMKGLKKIWQIDIYVAIGIGFVIACLCFFMMKKLINKKAKSMQNNKKSVNQLFTMPLIFAAALLSFAHGANDVANAVGPLAAINDVVSNGSISSESGIPIWVMLIGALGIAIGLALYGPKLIKTVGTEITELDQTRSFSIVMAAAITVIIASQLGLPVSSTHIAVGGVFGVGFLREYLKSNYAKMREEVHLHHTNTSDTEAEEFIERFDNAPFVEKRHIMMDIRYTKRTGSLSKRERRQLKRLYKTELVKRSLLVKIAAAWVITVPATGFLAAMIFFTIRGMMLP